MSRSYAFLAFVPTLIAVVSVYGLVASPADVSRQVDSFASALPDEVEKFISFQLKSIVESSRTGVSVTLAVALVIALWSASGGMAALITGLHVAQEQEQPRKFVVKRGKALLLTIAAVVLLTIVVFLVAALPGVVDDLGSAGRTALVIVRWPVLAFVMLVGIGALYRLSVRDARRGRWVLFTPGAVVATLGWIVVSVGFSFYTANFAHYSRTYGALATIVVLLLWLYLSACSRSCSVPRWTRSRGDVELRDQPLRRGQPVALDDEVAHFIPVLTTEVGVVPDPTARPDVRRDEVAIGVGGDERLVLAGGRAAAHGSAPVAVVVVEVVRELLAPHDERGVLTGALIHGFRQRETELRDARAGGVRCACHHTIACANHQI